MKALTKYTRCPKAQVPGPLIHAKLLGVPAFFRVFRLYPFQDTNNILLLLKDKGTKLIEHLPATTDSFGCVTTAGTCGLGGMHVSAATVEAWDGEGVQWLDV